MKFDKSFMFKAAVALRTAINSKTSGSSAETQGQTDPLSEIWDVLFDSSWKLLPASDLQLMAPALRATYAYAFGIEVRELIFLSLAAQEQTPVLPEHLSPEACRRVTQRLAYMVADEFSTDILAELFQNSRTDRVVDYGAVVAKEIFKEPTFGASVEFLLTEAHGPLGAAAAKTVAMAMREHACRSQLDPSALAPMRDLLQSFRYALPITRHYSRPGSLIVFCA